MSSKYLRTLHDNISSSFILACIAFTIQLLHVLSRYTRLERILMTMEMHDPTLTQFLDKAIPIEAANNIIYEQMDAFVSEVKATHGMYSQ